MSLFVCLFGEGAFRHILWELGQWLLTAPQKGMGKMQRINFTVHCTMSSNVPLPLLATALRDL